MYLFNSVNIFGSENADDSDSMLVRQIFVPDILSDRVDREMAQSSAAFRLAIWREGELLHPSATTSVLDSFVVHNFVRDGSNDLDDHKLA